MSAQNKVDPNSIEDIKIERDNILNPPDKEPGMDDWNIDNTLGNLNDNPYLGFESNEFEKTPDDWMSSLQQHTQQVSSEEKIFDAFALFFKGLFQFLKEFANSFSDFTVLTRLKTGRTIVITSICVFAVGITALIFGKTKGLTLVLSSMFSIGIGIPIFFCAYINIKNEEADTNFDENKEELLDINDDDDDDDDDDYDNDDDDDFFEEDFFDDDDENDVVSDSDNVKNNMDFILENMNVNILNGMIPRKFLYDNISNCLPYINPNFNEVKELDENENEFLAWDVIIQSSAKIIGGKNQEIDPMYLISAKEKLFYISLSIKRPRWLKNEDSLVKEIVNIYAFDNTKGVLDENITGFGVSVGDRVNIKIMKSTSIKISLKDTYNLVAKNILDIENYIPVVFGINMEGEVVYKDLKQMDSLLISGTPRTGKTSLALSILTQIASYLSPSEVEFHICDPKGSLSDYKSFQIPHVRKFVSSVEDILDELRYVVKVEGTRRQELIGNAGYVNIWDYKKRNPDIFLPLLYVVIDEVITLAETMDKDTKSEFQGLLSELVTRLPATGIRIIMMPHVIKNEIISKTVTDNIPCRISVMGSPEHIERTTGDKKFKEALKNKGDLAFRYFNEKTIFVHSLLLAPSNEEMATFFEFLSKFWLNLKPDSYEDSIMDLNKKTNSYPKTKNNKDISIKKEINYDDMFNKDEFDIW